MLKRQTLLKLAAFITAGNETLQLRALLVDATRILCCLKTVVSTPACCITVFIHPENSVFGHPMMWPNITNKQLLLPSTQ